MGKYAAGGELKPPTTASSRGFGKHPQLMLSTPRWAVANGAGIMLSVCVILSVCDVEAMELRKEAVHSGWGGGVSQVDLRGADQLLDKKPKPCLVPSVWGRVYAGEGDDSGAHVDDVRWSGSLRAGADEGLTEYSSVQPTAGIEAPGGSSVQSAINLVQPLSESVAGLARGV